MKIHIVRYKDYLADLAKKYQISTDRLLEANPHLSLQEPIKVGTKVRIPTGRISIKQSKMINQFDHEGNDFSSSRYRKVSDVGVETMSHNENRQMDDDGNGSLYWQMIEKKDSITNDLDISSSFIESPGSIEGDAELLVDEEEWTSPKEDISNGDANNESSRVFADDVNYNYLPTTFFPPYNFSVLPFGAPYLPNNQIPPWAFMPSNILPTMTTPPGFTWPNLPPFQLPPGFTWPNLPPFQLPPGFTWPSPPTPAPTPAPKPSLQSWWLNEKHEFDFFKESSSCEA